MNQPTSKTEALKQIIAIAKTNHISDKDLVQALEASTARSTHNEIIMKLLAYLGGIFIFSGIIIYTGTFWKDFGSFTKIGLTLGIGIVLYITAMVLPLYHKKIDHMLTPLFLTSAFFQTAGLFVTMHEFTQTPTNPHIAAMIVFAVMIIQQGMTWLKIKRDALIFILILLGCGFLTSFFGFFDISGKYLSLILGASLSGIAYYLDRSSRKALASFWYFFGSIWFLCGLFQLVEDKPYEIIYFAVSTLLIYISTTLKSKTLLFVGTVSTLGYIGYFSCDHFLKSAAWPIFLVVLGCTFFAVGALIFKLTKKYM